MLVMDFVVTNEFLEFYNRLDDTAVAVVDKAIRRLLVDHQSAWARQGRIQGESRDAWLLVIRGRELDLTLYWDYQDDQSLVLLAAVLT